MAIRYTPAVLAAHAHQAARAWCAGRPPRGTAEQAQAALEAAQAWQAEVIGEVLAGTTGEDWGPSPVTRAARAFEQAARPVRPVRVAHGALCHGYGTDPYKSVVGLDEAARLDARAGTAWLVVTHAAPAGGGHGEGHGSTRRVVVMIGGRYSRRALPAGITQEEVEEAR